LEHDNIAMLEGADTLADALRFHAKHRADVLATICDGRETNYRQLDERSSQVAQALLAGGVEGQTRIAILAHNSDTFFDLNFACWKIDAVLVPVNFRLAAPEIASILHDSEATKLFVDHNFYPLVEAISHELTQITEIVALDEPHANWQHYDDWRSPHPPTDPMMEVSRSNTCIQLYSSGTTGLPKGAEITHDNLLVLLPVALVDWMAWTPDDVSMVAMPLFHVAGCEWAYLGMAIGAVNVIMPAVEPREILACIERYRVTQTLFVPAVILFLLEHPDCAKTNFSSIKAIYYGASPIPMPVLTRAVETMGCGFAQLYGLTETTGAFTYLAPEDHDGSEKMKSCGKVMRTARARIVRDDGSDCEPGEVGEILCRSRQVMKGYWKQPELTQQVIVDGWFHTGDAGYLDAEGYLYVHDRMKDMVISGGENIYPAEVESALASHPAIADVAVIGAPDPKWGEKVVAIVVLRDGHQLSQDELVIYARERLAGYKVPREMTLIDELPRNPSGKILKRVLRAPYWSEGGRQVH
jgi:long-chain acyl-CoA synthetase